MNQIDQPTTPSNAHRRLPIIVAVLIGIALVGSLGYQLGQRGLRAQPSPLKPSVLPTPTVAPSPSNQPALNSFSAPAARQGWRAYRNQTYGYAIAHPETWLVHESYPSFRYQGRRVFHDLELGLASPGGYADGGPVVLLRVLAPGTNNRAIARRMISSRGEVVPSGTVELGGITGEQWSAAKGQGGYGVFFERDGRSYFLVVEGRGGVNDEVVASLRFE